MLLAIVQVHRVLRQPLALQRHRPVQQRVVRGTAWGREHAAPI